MKRVLKILGVVLAVFVIWLATTVIGYEAGLALDHTPLLVKYLVVIGSPLLFIGYGLKQLVKGQTRFGVLCMLIGTLLAAVVILSALGL